MRKPLLVIAALLAGAHMFAQSTTNITRYLVRGVFQESRNGGRQAVIRHETIPGYMDAMTMPFDVRQSDQLNSLQPGDKITFRLNITETEDWIDEIHRIGTSPPAPVPSPASTAGETELGTGAPLPDCILTNQSGRAFRLNQFKGRTLAFTFFFSRCPLPTFCPRMNRNFAAVQSALQADAAHTNWLLLSISFDPQFDTPSHLADQAALYRADTNCWNFATSSPEVIQQLTHAFGLMVIRNGTSFSHSLRTVVADASGHVQKVFTDNEWTPEELIAEMKSAMIIRP